MNRDANVWEQEARAYLAAMEQDDDAEKNQALAIAAVACALLTIAHVIDGRDFGGRVRE